MRCFIAIEFDEKIKALLAKIQDSLREAGVDGNYTHQPNFHLTLKFLGEIDSNTADRLGQLLVGLAAECEPFVLELGRLGKFNRGNRSLIWCGLENSDELAGLQKKTVEAINAGFPEFRESDGFSPHITLVREAAYKTVKTQVIKGGENGRERGASLNDLFERMGKPAGTVAARGISLMESARENGMLKYVRKRFFSFAEHH